MKIFLLSILTFLFLLSLTSATRPPRQPPVSPNTPKNGPPEGRGPPSTAGGRGVTKKIVQNKKNLARNEPTVSNRTCTAPPNANDTFVYLYHEPTNKCYIENGQNPCGKMMIFSREGKDSKTGVCVCDDQSVNTDQPEFCGRSRPKIYWPGKHRCYSFFSKGPCRKGDWLVLDAEGNPTCQINPCPQSNDAIEEQAESSMFYWFTHNGQCYRTFTYGFCNNNRFLVPTEDAWKPHCSNEPNRYFRFYDREPETLARAGSSEESQEDYSASQEEEEESFEDPDADAESVEDEEEDSRDVRRTEETQDTRSREVRPMRENNRPSGIRPTSREASRPIRLNIRPNSSRESGRPNRLSSSRESGRPRPNSRESRRPLRPNSSRESGRPNSRESRPPRRSHSRSIFKGKNNYARGDNRTLKKDKYKLIKVVCPSQKAVESGEKIVLGLVDDIMPSSDQTTPLDPKDKSNKKGKGKKSKTDIGSSSNKNSYKSKGKKSKGQQKNYHNAPITSAQSQENNKPTKVSDNLFDDETELFLSK